MEFLFSFVFRVAKWTVKFQWSTFNATLGDFRLCLVAEKMQKNYRTEKFHVFMFKLFNSKKERKKET